MRGTRRYAYNPPVWNRLPTRVQSNYPGGRGAYNQDFPVYVNYRIAKPAPPRASKTAKKKAASRRRAATRRLSAARKKSRATRRNPAPYRSRRVRRSRIATRRNPAIVRMAEQKFGKLPFIGQWAGAAAGASVFALGGAASLYLTRYLLAMDSIADFEAVQWLKVRPHWAYALGGVLMGAVARMVTPGDQTTKRAAQLAVTSAGFGAGTLLYMSSQEDLMEFAAAKAAEEAAAAEA